MKAKTIAWLLVGLLVLAWGAALAFTTLWRSSQYTACRQLPALTHNEIVLNCAPFLRTTLMWAAFSVAILGAGLWAVVRAFRLDRIGRAHAGPAVESP